MCVRVRMCVRARACVYTVFFQLSALYVRPLPGQLAKMRSIHFRLFVSLDMQTAAVTAAAAAVGSGSGGGGGGDGGGQ